MHRTESFEGLKKSESSEVSSSDFSDLFLPSDLLRGVDDQKWLEISCRVPIVPLEILLSTEPDIIDYHLAD